MKWQPSDTAPKDKIIIADFGLPQLSLAIWNGCDEKWSTVALSAQVMEGEKIDYWFENEQEPTQALKYWMPLPKLCLR